MAATSVIDRCISLWNRTPLTKCQISGSFCSLIPNCAIFHCITDNSSAHGWWTWPPWGFKKEKKLEWFSIYCHRKNRQSQPMPKRVSRLRSGLILEPEYNCALTENPAIWQWPDPLGIRRVGRPLKVIWDPPPAYLQALQQRLGQRGSGWAFPSVPHCPTLLNSSCHDHAYCSIPN